MRILLVYCHPVPESYCAAIRETAIRALKLRGHEVDLLDLYEDQFNPVMGSAERRNYNQMKLNDHPFPDHAERLQSADGILFVYPTWWYGLPAMLKGWLDRVWTPEVTFTLPENGPIKPLMTHVKFLGVITTCGATRFWSNLVGHPGRRTILRGIRALCATRCKTLFLAHYSMDASTDASRAAFIKKVERYLARL